LEALTRALADHGHAIEDLELLVISHQHIDHLGLTGLLASRSGAQVAAIDVLAPYVERYSEHAEADDGFATGVMLANGIPADVVSALQSVSRAFRAWGARADVSRVLHAGQDLELRDRTLTVHHRPGHSPTDTIFHDAERRMLIAADHLLPHISSNPLITRPPEEGGARPKALLTYMESLTRTRAMDLDVLLPGHGEPFTGHAELIDKRFALHDRRAEKLHGLIAERPRTAYELAQALWGNIAVTQAFLTLSEVLGHTDLLEREGRVRAMQEDGVTRFVTA
jgi:glyoxylase-like metal-dependent hydrolase (beta-lactamase superfamily II)